ncbi:MAG: NAD(P)H-dependent oxidoreductase subunit E [Ornithinimicrobium sp.]
MSAQIDTGTRQDTVRSIAQGHSGERGPLLIILHAVQADLGYIDEGDVPVIADVLNQSIAEVHGVVSFYKDFRTSPAPAHTVAVCRAEACQAVGASAVFEAAERTFAGSADVEVEEIFCFGNCALGPTAMIDGVLHGRVDEQRVAELTGEWA